MNWNKINPNVQTLGNLISKTDFVYWFLSLTSDTISNQLLGNNYAYYSYYSLFDNQMLPQTNWGMYSNWPRLSDLWQMKLPTLANGTSFNVNTQITNLLGTIYDLFKNSIPYNQTTTSQQIITFAPSLAQMPPTANNTTTQIPLVLNEISAYLDLYINHIIQYVILAYKYFVEGNILSSGLTNQKTENENEGTSGQNSGYNGNTFNPVNSNFSPTISPIPINNSLNTPNNQVNQLPQGNASNLSKDTPATNSQGIEFTSLNNLANASVNSNGFTNNKKLNRTYSYLNINELNQIGNSQTLTILRPLIYKLSTLFWTLGNDNYPHDDINWGFNIW